MRQRRRRAGTLLLLLAIGLVTPAVAQNTGTATIGDGDSTWTLTGPTEVVEGTVAEYTVRRSSGTATTLDEHIGIIEDVNASVARIARGFSCASADACLETPPTGVTPDDSDDESWHSYIPDGLWQDGNTVSVRLRAGDEVDHNETFRIGFDPGNPAGPAGRLFVVTVRNADRPGSVTIGQLTDGAVWDLDRALTATLSDPDGARSVRWQWQRSTGAGPTPAWSDIAGATLSVYTPGTVDIETRVRVRASYDDGDGTGKTAHHPGRPVQGICRRTLGVQSALLRVIPEASGCADVLVSHLEAVSLVEPISATSLRIHDFHGLSALPSLQIRGAGLASLSPDAFLGLENLVTLNLNGHSLTTIESGWLNGLDSLEDLRVVRGDLGELPDDAFANVPTLKTLHLHNNELTVLARETFDDVPDLEELLLHNNMLPSVSNDVFDGITGLESLDLRWNGLTVLPEGFFLGHTELTDVRFLHNPMLTDLLTLTVTLARTDGLPWTTAGPATVSATIREGAPRRIPVRLGTDGNLSAEPLVIPAGQDASPAAVLTPMDGETHARVFIRSLPAVGEGLTLARGNPALALPPVSVGRQEWTATVPVSLRLPAPVGGDGALAYSAPNLPDGVALDGRDVSGTPRTATGERAVIWTVTDASGASVSLRFTVTVSATVPAAPQNLSAAPGVEEVTLSWTAGRDHGAAIDLWQYRVSADAESTWSGWTDIPSSDASTESHVAPAPAGTVHVFEVRAHNSIGYGPAAKVTAPRTLPNSVPTFGGATLADQVWNVGVAVNLSLPEAVGGDGVLSYEFLPSLPAGLTLEGNDLSGAPTSLLPATESTWVVTDDNGDRLEVVFDVTIEPGPPFEPLNLRAVSGLDRRADLSWEAGLDNGAPIDYWQVRASADNGATWSEWARIPGGGNVTTHTATRLLGYMQHILEVRAHNSAGFGAAARAAATPVELDTLPTFGGASVADQAWKVGTEVSLVLPEADEGNYPYTYGIDPPLPDGTTLTGMPLTNWTITGTPTQPVPERTHTLTATDKDLDEATLEFAVTVDPDVPAAPTGLQATAGVEQVELSWPTGNGNGAAITLWQYRVRTDGSATWSPGWTSIPSSDADTTVHTVTGLAASVAHTFQVRARNSVGNGPAASATATPREPDVEPTFGAATVADQAWTVGTEASLELPEATGGNGDLAYSLEPPGLPAGMDREGRVISGTPTEAAAAAEYGWVVTDEDGDRVSVTFDIAVNAGAPEAPTNLQAEPGVERADLTWEAGADNGAAIELWQYRVSTDGGASWSPDWTGIPSSDADTTMHAVTGLAAGVEHTFEVRARNSAGPGPAASATATPAEIDVVPTFSGAGVENQTWKIGTPVNLDLPEATGGNGELTYVFTGDLPDGIARSGRNISGTPTTPTAARQYQWTATDRDMDSVALEFMVTVLAGEPGAPTNLQAAAGTLEVSLEWEAGADNGAAINLWQYRVSTDGGASWSPNWSDVPSSGANTTMHTVTGLAAGVEHTFEVRARNSTGFGPAASATATPAAADVAPTFGAATVADQVWTVGTEVDLELPEAAGGNGALAYSLEPSALPAGVTRNGRIVSGAPAGAAAAETYRWIATDGDGDRVSVTFTVTVNPGAPAAPANLRANPGVARADLAWEAGPDNGAAVTLWQYRVSTDGGAAWSPDWTGIPGSDADTTTHAVTGLAANVEHTFEVRAQNSAGFGPAASATATPTEPDVAPTFSGAGVENQTWRIGTPVNLELPEATGGNGALTYVFTGSLPDGITRAGRNISGTPTTPTAARQYRWTATDADMDSVALEFMAEVVAGAPGAPRNLRATAGTLEVSLEWEAGADNGAAIDLWQYRVSTDGGASWSPDWTDIPSSGANTTMHTVSGLAANTEHTFQVRARNSGGFSQAASATATPAAADVAPTFGAATVSDQDWTVGAEVDLELPEATGGNGDLTYSLEPPELPAGVTRTGRAVSGTPTEVAAAGTYRWIATDGDGDHVSVTFTIAVSPGIPAAPTNLRADPGVGQAALTWAAGSDNGAAVTLWQYRVSTDGGTNWSPDWTDIPASDADTTVHTVTELAANTEHTFEVRARNSAGPGRAASTTATPTEPDVEPTFGAAAVPDQVWTAGTEVELELPEATGGNGALDYSLEPSELPAGVTRTGRDVSGTPTEVAAAGTYRWIATDGDGDRASVTFAVTVEPGTPDAPRNLQATAGTLEVVLRWEAGADNGATIDRWQYRVSTDGGANWSPDWTDVPFSGAGTTEHTVDGLAASVEHTFEVRAQNSAGDGRAASATAAPRGPDVNPTFGTATVPDQAWTVGTEVELELPEATGGNGELAYSLVPPALPAGVTINGRVISGTPDAAAAAEIYGWFATDEDGDRVAVTFPITVNPGAPAAPMNLRAVPGVRQAALAWEAGSDNGAAIDRWQYRVSTDGGSNWSPDWADIPSSGANTTMHTVTGLAANTEHTFEVRARNSAGFGEAASASATPVEADVAPTFGAATVADQTWTVGTEVALELPQASDGNGDLVHTLEPPVLPAGVDLNGRVISGTPAATAAAETYRWVATDEDGDRASVTFTVAVDPGVPAAPTNLRADPGVRQAALTWEAGADNGAAVTLWQYRVSTDGGASWSPDWTGIPSSGANTTMHTVTGLAASVAHTFEVRAQNSVGDGSAASATATPRGTDVEPTFGAEAVADQAWTVGTEVALELPEATGGNGPLGYSLEPSALPAGVALNGRVISGTPAEAEAAETYRWIATDEDGDRVSVTFTVSVDPGVPAAPTNLRADPGVRQAALTWEAGSDNGAAVTLWQYRVSADGGGSWSPDWTGIPSSGANTTMHTVTGLAASVAHTFEVRAQNSVGDGSAASATATPRGTDVEPTFGAETVADQTWTVGTEVDLMLPEASGGNGPLGYSLEPPALPAGVALIGRVISGTPAATAAAEAYRWIATDEDGDRVSVTFTVSVDPGVPAAPTNLRADPGVWQVALTWVAGSDNGAAVTLWQYRVSADGGGGWSPDWTDVPFSGAGTTEHTVDGLAASVAHTFEVRAQNSVGSGPASSASATPRGTDVEPTFGAATVADQTWTVGTEVDLELPQASDGNGPLGYSLEPPALPTGVDLIGRVISGTPAATATAETYRWIATDEDGDRVSVTFTVSVDPGVPAAPTNLRADPGVRQAALTWVAGSDNGSAVTLWQYRVSANGGGSWSPDWTDIPSSDAGTTMHTVTGLAASVAHTFEVRAQNSVGSGPASSASATPRGTDVEPTFGSATVADQAWTVGTEVDLELPEATGGNGALGYSLEPSALPAGVDLNGRAISGTPAATAAAEAYRWIATDEDGDRVSVTFTVSVDPSVPAAPTNLRADPGVRQAALAWEAGADNGAAVTLWQYRVSADGGGSWSPDWTDIPSSDADTTVHAVTGLAASVAHTFEVRAQNSVGIGPAASATATPRGTDVEPTFGAATVADQAWTVGTEVVLELPEATGGNGPLGYSLEPPALPAGVTRNGRIVSGTPTGVATAASYDWIATDEDGDRVSVTFTVSVDPDVPAAPTDLRADPGVRQAALTWEAGSDNGATVDRWQYRVSTDGGANWSPDWTDIPSSGADTTMHTVTGLAANTGHTFEVRAHNSAGFGEAASASATPVEDDAEPTFGSASVPDQDWTVGTQVDLELPEATGGNGVLGYSLEPPALPAGVTRNGRIVSGAPTEVAAAGTYRWVATDGDGDRASVAFTVTVGPDTPDAPRNLRATAGTLEVTLRWEAGADNGAPIDLWQYRVSTDDGANWSPDWTGIPSSDAGTTVHTATGLAANTGHTFEVRAHNSAGFGEAASASATPSDADTEPTFGGANIPDQAWKVGTAASLELPEAAGGNGALRYTLEPRLPAGMTRAGRDVSGTPAEPAAARRHTWTAIDEDGDRAELSFMVTVEADVPGAARNLRATAGAPEVALRWDIPPDNGAPITLWQYRVSADGGLSWAPDWADIPSSDEADDAFHWVRTIPGLETNIAYTFEVRALNSVGAGAVASVTLDVEPTFGGAGLPDQLWRVGTAVNLDLPEAFGGNGALSHGFDGALPAGVARSGRGISGTPATPTASRQHRWTATDADGDSVALEFAITVEPGVPGAPVGLQATAGTAQAVLRWEAGPDNSAAVTLWQYRVSTDGGVGWSPDWAGIPSSDADTTMHTVTGLEAGIAHTFEVRAQNSAGAGASARATATPTEADTAPTFGGATVDDQVWTVGRALELVLPEATGGNGESRLTLSPMLPAGVSLAGRTVSGTPTAVAAGQAYTWAATDSDGDSVTLEFSVAVRAGTPAAPASFTLERGYGRVTLDWTPGDESGAPADRWQYRMSTDGGVNWVPGWTDIDTGDGSTGHVLSGLAGLTEHTIEVRAQNSAGDGDPARETVIPLLDPDVDRDGDYDHTDSLLGFYSLRFGNFLLANTRLLDLVFGRLVGSEYRPEHGPQIISRSRQLGEDAVYRTLDVDEDGDVDHGDLLLAFYSLRFGNFLLANTRLLNLVYSRIVTGGFPEGFGEKIIDNTRRLEQDYADKTPGN